jgi:hypothetical protein
MPMDVLDVGALEDTDLFDGLESCFQRAHFDPDIASLWNAMLKQPYPDGWAHDEPKLDWWHHGFKALLEHLALHGSAIPFGRHLGTDLLARGRRRISVVCTIALPNSSGVDP